MPVKKQGHIKQELPEVYSYTDNTAEIQTMINAASNGQTVLIPEGIFFWSAKINIPDNKKIILKGAGIDKTIIYSDLNTAVIELNASGSRVTQICFKLINDIGVCIRVCGLDWRIDHCKFDFIGTEDYTIEGVYPYGSDVVHPEGLIDHCEFNNTRICVMGQQKLMANERWAEDLELGTKKAVFAEDNVFTRTFASRNVMDSNYGARYVFRYNIVNNSQVMAHSVQDNSRAARCWEVYNNVFNQYDLGLFCPFFMRGGTGVIFNNTVNGSWSYPYIVADNYRSFQYFEGGGLADGTSPWDGNTPGEFGYPARDQIGRSTDRGLWTINNLYPEQELDPMYQWNNKHNGINMTVYVHNNCGHHIKVNRDYYDNVQRPGYTPYQYPHPLNVD